MNRLFQNVKTAKIRKNSFDLSHEKKLSMNMGELVPILLQEVVPGDSFRVNTELLMRLAPLTAPVMHRVNAYTHYFFVPNRLLYSEWESFITGGVDGQAAPAFPRMTFNGSTRLNEKGSVGDYFGIPVTPVSGAFPDFDVSALPFRAYALIYNEFYRDQTLNTAVAMTKNSTCNLAEFQELVQIRKRCWEKDYFTSALPWSQRGGEVILPNDINYQNAEAPGTPALGNIQIVSGGGITDSAGNPIDIENISNVGTTINDLRRATRLQTWLERNARAGSRYVEQIFSHFKVVSSDARLQRPEYLGGGVAPIVISEVLSTAETEGAPLGEFAGHGICVGNSNRFSKTFEEHGYIIGILSVIPRTAYYQGIDRSMTKFDKFDYYWPEFAQIGEQEVKNQEIYFDFAGVANPDDTFGYQSRYAEYKHNRDSVHGDFRDNLLFWTMVRDFSSPPALNGTFVTSNPTHDIFAVQDPSVDKLYVQLFNKINALRPMPQFGEPTL